MAARTQHDRASDSRRRLLDAARIVLAERGYAGTTLAAIGEQAGLSRGLVTHHFGSKEACIAAVVDHVRGEFVAALREEGAYPRGLRTIDRLIAFYFDMEPDRLQLSRSVYSVTIEATTSAPGLLSTVADHDATVRRSIVTAIRQAAEMGEIPAVPDDVETVAVMIGAMLRGAVLQWLVRPEDVDRAAFRERMSATVRTVLGVRDDDA